MLFLFARTGYYTVLAKPSMPATVELGFIRDTVDLGRVVRGGV
jgi:hypothetical protein